MIQVSRTFNPIKLILNTPQDVLDLRRAIEESIHKLDNKFWGLKKTEVSPNHTEYYARMKYLLEILTSVPTKKEFTD